VLKNKKIGFIGAGMMAEATIRGLLKAGMDASKISASDPSEARRDLLRKELGVAATTDNRTVAQSADIIVIATKPFVVADALASIADVLQPKQLVVSIAAGVTIDSIQSKLPSGTPVVRVMPNTPALIGEGAAALAPGKQATQAHLDLASEIFSASGKVVQLTEDKLDAVTGLSGSGPAFVYTFIEALADGGVRMGIPKATALLLAAQTVLGAAKMVLDAGEHPAVLRDKVMTPGGTTIAGMASLERDKFRSACIEAVTAATNRSAELGKPKG
jgi:pyrroline-5-carboxylate reductase